MEVHDEEPVCCGDSPISMCRGCACPHAPRPRLIAHKQVRSKENESAHDDDNDNLVASEQVAEVVERECAEMVLSQGQTK